MSDEREVCRMLEFMRERGSSISLNWGEGTDCWECAWITGGNRYFGVNSSLFEAVLEARNRAFRAREMVSDDQGADSAVGLRGPKESDDG
jgi:hypothetical protein